MADEKRPRRREQDTLLTQGREQAVGSERGSATRQGGSRENPEAFFVRFAGSEVCDRT